MVLEEEKDRSKGVDLGWRIGQQERKWAVVLGEEEDRSKGSVLVWECIERARNISAEANFSAILNFRQVSCDCPFEGINPSTAQF